MASARPVRELGLPHLLLLLLAPLVPPVLSGALRAGFADPLLLKRILFDVPLSVCLVLGIVATVAGLGWALIGTHLRAPGAWTAVGASTLVVVGSAAAWWCLYNPRFDGLVTVGGGDAGAYLAVRDYFIRLDPSAGKGEVAFHSLTYWMERVFHLDAFSSFRASFYVTVEALLLVIAAAGAMVARDAGPRVWALLVGTFGLVISVILLPLVHYLQADGFYSQLFGLVPLFTCWAVYGLARRSGTHLVVLVVWVAATRFTYALNLGDVLVSAAVITALEARSSPTGFWKRFQWGFALLFLAAAPFAYVELLRLWRSAGGVVRPIIALVIVGEMLLTVGLGLLPRLARRTGYPVSLGQYNVARFAAIFGLTNLVPQLAYAVSGRVFQYYVIKYNFLAVALLVSAVAILAPVLAQRIGPPVSRSSVTRRQTNGTLAALAVGVLVIAGGYQPYLRSFAERCRPWPPWRTIGPLVDREGARRIASVLSAEGRPFAGLLGSSWPMTHFMNADLGEPTAALTRNWEELGNWAMQTKPGCLFWYGGSQEQANLERRQEAGAAQVLARLRQMEAIPDKHCEFFLSHWDPSRLLVLCHVCDRVSGSPAAQLPSVAPQRNLPVSGGEKPTQ